MTNARVCEASRSHTRAFAVLSNTTTKENYFVGYKRIMTA